MSAVHALPLRAYYADTDAGGLVYHAAYLAFFERARWEMLASAGIDPAVAARAGEGGYVVAEARLRYLAPALLGDQLVIETSVLQLGAASMLVQHEAMRDRALLVSARIRLAFVGPAGKPRRAPAAWMRAVRSMMGTGSG